MKGSMIDGGFWRRRAAAVLVSFVVVGSAMREASAQPRPQATGRSADSTTRTSAATAPASPRAALRRFLELTRAGDFAQAAGYLEIADSAAARGPELARRLKIVLDRHVWLDLDDVSGLAVGDTTDGLAPGVDQIGVIRGAKGDEPVRLRRVSPGSDEEVSWRFSAGTVTRVPAWFDALPNHWLIERLPATLLRPGPFDVVWWQWLAVLVLVPAGLALGWTASRLLRGVLQRAAARTETEFDDLLVQRLGGPLTTGLSVIAMSGLLPLLGLYRPAAELAERSLHAMLLLAVFWAFWRMVDVGRNVAERTPWARSVASSRSLLPLGARAVKIVILVLALVAALSLLGYPVTSLVAGLGLGGLALALAAQKTVENLFGAFSIGIDQPFREGDFVKIEDFVGTVETIGLRSTRFRTLDRTLISIPNGRLADMRLESFTARDRMRLAMIARLAYGTTVSQMQTVLAGLERVLRAHPKIWPDAVVVRFAAFGPSSYEIEIMAWFATPDWGEFQRIRQDVLLQFMEVVEQAGTSLALPAQTVHVATATSSAA